MSARALILDFDGLIVDSETVHAHGLVELLAEEGVPIGIDQIAHLYGGTGEEIDRGWDELLEPFGNRDFSTFERRLFERIDAELDALPLLPGVAEVLDQARTLGWPVGLATGRERDRLLPQLRRLALEDTFDAVVLASEVERGKPAPDIFLETARRLGVAPSGCVVLEDSLPGSRAALAAGMTVVVCPCAVTRGCTFPDGVRPVGSLADVDLAAL